VAGAGQRDGPIPRQRGDLTGKNPTDRSKLGTKRHNHVEGRGMPIGNALSGANRHDCKMAVAVLRRPVVRRPKPTRKRRQHIGLDKGYDYPFIRTALKRRGYDVHIPKRGGSPVVSPVMCHRARRWVVERTGRWQNLFRRLKTRYEVYSANYEGFVHLANAIICFRSCRR